MTGKSCIESLIITLIIKISWKIILILSAADEFSTKNQHFIFMASKKQNPEFTLRPFQDENIRKYEKIPTVIFETALSASKAIAREIADYIRKKKGNCVLGLPTA